MVSFSQPIMLWGLLVLAVPVIIHLFSRSKHRQLPISTLAFFPDQLPINRKQIKLTQRRLLLIRLLLLTVVILLLSGIRITDKSSLSDTVHLVTNDWLATATEQQRNKLAEQLSVSNREQGPDVFALNTNQQISAEHLVNKMGNIDVSAINVWRSVAQWVDQYGGATPNVVVHTTNRLSQFLGEPVALPESVSWSIIEPKVTAAQTSEMLSLSVLLVGDTRPSGKQTGSTKQLVEDLNLAFNTLNQARSVNIEILGSTVAEVKAEDFEQVNAVILLDGNLKNADKINASRVIVEAAQLVPLRGADFPLLLAEKLFQPVIEKHYWRNARINPASVRNLENSKAYSATPFKDKPLSLPIGWVVLCILLFAFERFFSEKLLASTRVAVADD